MLSISYLLSGVLILFLVLYLYPFSYGKEKENDKTQMVSRCIKHSNALALKDHVFTLDDPEKIAASLKRSAKHSHREKSPLFSLLCPC
jgi:hypothetical protein